MAAITPFAPAAIAAPRPLDLTDPKTKLEAQVRMRSRLDGGRTFMPYRGTVFGKPEGKIAVALYDVEGFSFTEAHRIDDLSWRLTSVEAGYFIDRTTGQPLDRWTNPMNGLQTRVEHYRSWLNSIAEPDTVRPPKALPPGMTYVGRIDPATVIDGKVWLNEDLFVAFPSQPQERYPDPLYWAGPQQTGTSLATWCCDLAALSDRDVAFVPTTLSYESIGTFRPFMRMGAAPGVSIWRMVGTKTATIDGVPRHLRERVLKDYPDFLTQLVDPGLKPIAVG